MNRVLPDHGPGRRPDVRPTQQNHLERLINKYGELTNVPPPRVRRWISTMVLLGALERVSEQESPRFLLKGGIAMELRLGVQARATKDIDITFVGDPDVLEEILDEALAEEYSGFSFRHEEIQTVGKTSYRWTLIRLTFARKGWATVKVEIAPPELTSLESEAVPAISIDDFGLEGPKTVTCLSVRYQIAQKIHAVTEQPEHRENDRFRDLIDLLLLRDLVDNLQPVRVACVEIFEARDMHAWPPEFVVPDSWTEPYRALAQETGFDIEDVYEAAEEVRASIAAIDAAI